MGAPHLSVTLLLRLARRANAACGVGGRRTVGYDGRDADSNPLTSPETNRYEATVVESLGRSQSQRPRLRIGNDQHHHT